MRMARLQAWIHRLAFERQDAENAFVHAPAAAPGGQSAPRPSMPSANSRNGERSFAARHCAGGGAIDAVPAYIPDVNDAQVFAPRHFTAGCAMSRARGARKQAAFTTIPSPRLPVILPPTGWFRLALLIREIDLPEGVASNKPEVREPDCRDGLHVPDMMASRKCTCPRSEQVERSEPQAACRIRRRQVTPTPSHVSGRDSIFS